MYSCDILFPAHHQITIIKNPSAAKVRHNHTFFELNCIKTGRCLAELGGHSFFLPADSFAFLPPDTDHLVHPNQDCIWYQLLIAPDVLEQLLSFDNNIFCEFFLQSVFTKESTDCLISHTASAEPDAWLLLDAMTQECQKADLYSDKMLFHLLLTLFYKLMRIGEMTILGSHDFAKKTHMAVIARYMLQNYTCASLAGLADQLNYSLSYCSHFVLENTGFTFKQLQKKIRMQKAVSYLLYADTPVNLIAEQLGYSCSENFMKVFKQEYGLTPTQYRARMKPQ